MRVGFVGLGTMGAPMAANLLRKGFEVTVHNRTRARELPLAELGAARAASPAEAARGAEFVVVVVSDTPDVEAVLLGPGGVAEGAAPGTVVVDMSTIDPEATAGLAARLAERAVALVDAPVSGGSEGAAAGTLSIMAGGEPAHVDAARPVLEALGSIVIHVGPSGAGQTAKAINQVVVAGTYLAVAEGMAFGMRAGLDMDRVLEALSAGAAGSWVLANRARRMLAGEFPLGFKVRLHRKDLGIALAAAARLGLELPAARLAARLEEELVARGLGDADVAAIIRAVLEPPAG